MLAHTPPEVKSYRQIPYAFRADPVALDGMKIPRTARDVFALILDNAKARGWRTRLSNGAMARVLGCTTMTIKRALAALESAGLIHREYVAGGRIRTGIRVTWDGVEQQRSTERTPLEQSRSTGGTSMFRGVEHPRSTNQSPPQSESSDGVSSLSGGEEDPASRVAEGPEAAAYLRAMIAAGRKGQCQGQAPPPPPGGSSELGQTSPPAKASCVAQPLSAPQDTPHRVVKGMVDQLVERFTEGVPTRRRLSPRQLQAQILEVRRKKGGRR